MWLVSWLLVSKASAWAERQLVDTGSKSSSGQAPLDYLSCDDLLSFMLTASKQSTQCMCLLHVSDVWDYHY